MRDVIAGPLVGLVLGVGLAVAIHFGHPTGCESHRLAAQRGGGLATTCDYRGRLEPLAVLLGLAGAGLGGIATSFPIRVVRRQPGAGLIWP